MKSENGPVVVGLIKFNIQNLFPIIDEVKKSDEAPVVGQPE